jgi:hypothetical protein
MVRLSENKHSSSFILSEAAGQRSRGNVTLLGGFTGASVLKAGTVLGKITSSGKYASSASAGSDGSQIGAAILMYQVDATDGDVEASVIARDAEVNGLCLEYDSTVNTDNEKAAKATELAAAGIIVRT